MNQEKAVILKLEPIPLNIYQSLQNNKVPTQKECNQSR